MNTPRPYKFTVDLSMNNVGMAIEEGSLSLKALRHLSYLENALSTAGLDESKRQTVKIYLGELRKVIEEQLRYDCRDLVNGRELNRQITQLIH